MEEGCPRGGGKGVTSTLRTIVVLALAAGLWEVACVELGVRQYVLPKPSVIAGALWEYRSSLGTDSAFSVAEASCGFLIACSLSFVIAVLLVYVPSFRASALSAAVALKSVPIVILAPIFLVWFGYGLVGKLLLAAIVTFFPLLIALLQGMSATTKAERDLFRIYGASRWQTITRLMTPRSVPFLMAGLRVTAPTAVLGSLIAETAGARRGLGITMMIASANFNTSLLFAAAFLSASIGLLAFALVAAAERLATKYMEQ